MLLDYFFLPMVIWLIGAAYLNGAVPRRAQLDLDRRVHPADHGRSTCIGIKLAAKANFVLMAFQILVLVFFVVLSSSTSRTRRLAVLDRARSATRRRTFGAIAAGAAIAAYSFLGFDAVTTLTEETERAAQDHPPRHRAGRR